MDCISFRNHINDYMEDRLDDAELNEFLHHMEACNACKDELEINYIVFEGINILDKKGTDYDLKSAYMRSIDDTGRYLSIKKIALRFVYIIDTVRFWAVFVCVLLFLRILLIG